MSDSLTRASPPPANGGAGNLPDVNAETYPYEVVQAQLDRAAFFHLYAVPSQAASESPGLLTDQEDWFALNGGYGLDIVSRLHPFDSSVDQASREGGVQVRPQLHQSIGELRAKWFFGVEGLGWDLAGLPAPAIFDAWRSQPFALREGRLLLGERGSGFEVYGVGRTYSIASEHGPQLACCACGNLAPGLGDLAGLEGTFSLNGIITKELGFMGSVGLRIVDPEKRLELRDGEILPATPSAQEAAWFADDGGTYIAMRGEKENRSIRTTYGPSPGAGLVTLVTPAVMKSVRYPVANRGGRIAVGIEPRATIANLLANVSLNILAPPGTAAVPNDFQTRNVYTFVDVAGRTVGTITAWVETGKSFNLTFPAAPGQLGMRFAGFGKIIGGTGVFEGVQGTVMVNSAIGIAPHALSMLEVFRLVDPCGRFRAALGGNDRKADRRPTGRTTERYKSSIGASTVAAGDSREPAKLPDLEHGLHPFGVIQRALEKAAIFNLFVSPTPEKAPVPRNKFQAQTKFQIAGPLHRFRIHSTVAAQGEGMLKATNLVGGRLGTVNHEIRFVPDDFVITPGERPPETPLDPTRSQRFVLANGIFNFAGGDDSFHGFGSGQTYPINVDGRSYLMMCAIGTITQGQGKFRGLAGTYVFTGTFSERSGYCGAVVLRLIDEDGIFRVDDPLPAEDEIVSETSGLTFFQFQGRKHDETSRTTYGYGPDGEPDRLELTQILSLFEAATTNAPDLRTHASAGPAIGKISSKVFLNLLRPNGLGTDASPIPFQSLNEFRLQADNGSDLGGFRAFGGEGRSFAASLKATPGTPYLRFGAFQEIGDGTLAFAFARGVLSDNSIVSLSPHVTSTLYTICLVDPRGDWRDGGRAEERSAGGGSAEHDRHSTFPSSTENTEISKAKGLSTMQEDRKMYIYVELWEAKEAWKALTTEQRFAKIEQLLNEAHANPITGVIPVSVRSAGELTLFDGIIEQPAIISDSVARPTGFRYMSAYIIPTLDLIRKFEKRVENLGWWFDYFHQVNAWGLMDREACVADMATLGKPAPPAIVRTSRVALDLEGTKAGEQLNVLKASQERGQFCWCPPGRFQMGLAGIEVSLTRGFWMGKYLVTQAQYQAVTGENPSGFRGASLPVESVEKETAMAFCEKLTALERAAGRLPDGWEYRLPTEAQWEYACRAGTTTAYSWGNDESVIGNYAWYAANSGERTHPVGEKRPNAWGIHDMHGNCIEWCRDPWMDELPGGVDPEVTVRDLPARPGWSKTPFWICRGGSWQYPQVERLRSGNRERLGPRDRSYLIGFRIALVRTAA